MKYNFCFHFKNDQFSADFIVLKKKKNIKITSVLPWERKPC